MTTHAPSFLTITVGQFATDPAEHAFSKVAGRVDLSIDLRSRSPVLLARAPNLMRDIAAQIARHRGVSIDLGPLSGTEPALMDERLAMRLTGMAEAGGSPFRGWPAEPAMTRRSPPITACRAR